MDLDLVERLRDRHPAWRLLRARNAPLVLSFLGEHLIEANHGPTAAGHLTAALDDILFDVHRTDPDRYPSGPQAYLDDWRGRLEQERIDWAWASRRRGARLGP